jgi:hypothetical protein
VSRRRGGVPGDVVIEHAQLVAHVETEGPFDAQSVSAVSRRSGSDSVARWTLRMSAAFLMVWRAALTSNSDQRPRGGHPRADPYFSFESNSRVSQQRHAYRPGSNALHDLGAEGARRVTRHCSSVNCGYQSASVFATL